MTTSKSFILKFEAGAEPTLSYDRILPTGLGDRFSVMLCVAALSAAVGERTLIPWYVGTMSDASRSYDYDTVAKYVRFPSSLLVVPGGDVAASRPAFAAALPPIRYNTDGLLPAVSAFDGVPTIALQTMALPSSLNRTCSQAEFERAYRKISREFEVIMPELKLLPKGFVVVHIRGGDKRTHGGDGKFVTTEVVDRLAHKTVLILVTDDPEHSRTIVSAETPMSANPCAQLPAGNERDLCDFGVMLRAAAIVQHSAAGWSAYSSLAAMLREIPCLNTFVDGDSGVDGASTYPRGPLRRFSEQKGGCPKELRSAQRENDTEEFVSYCLAL